MNLVRRYVEGLGNRRAHHGQPFRGGLAAGVLADDKVAAIPVHGRPYFGNVPIVKPENLDILFFKTFAQVSMTLFDPVGQHHGLIAVFLLCVWIKIHAFLLGGLQNFPPRYPSFKKTSTAATTIQLTGRIAFINFHPPEPRHCGYY